MSLLLRAAVDVDLDNRPHCGPLKFWQGLVYSLHKTGRGKFVGLCHKDTEPSELCLPFGEGCFDILLVAAVSRAMPTMRESRRVHFRRPRTLASRMADGEMKPRRIAISCKAASNSL